jgi:hypothetical protein
MQIFSPEAHRSPFPAIYRRRFRLWRPGWRKPKPVDEPLEWHAGPAHPAPTSYPPGPTGDG